MMRKIEKIVAYNPNTEQELHFNNKKLLADFFGLSKNTISYWFRFGRPIIDLMSTEQDRGMLEKAIKAQSRLKGFEIYTQTEWEEMA